MLPNLSSSKGIANNSIKKSSAIGAKRGLVGGQFKQAPVYKYNSGFGSGLGGGIGSVGGLGSAGGSGIGASNFGSNPSPYGMNYQPNA